MNDTLNWVVGSGGLLGSSVAHVVPPGEEIWAPPVGIQWANRSRWSRGFAELVAHFAEAVGEKPWRVWWCAGRGTVSSSRAVLDDEIVALSFLLDALSMLPIGWRRRGAVVFSSSAGSIYAGSPADVIGPDTEPAPLNGYGEMKLQAEHMVHDFGRNSEVRTLVARITNLYGPKQDMSKAQGLITTVCASILKRSAVPIFVSLGTVRNYVYAEDAAQLMWRCLQETSSLQQSTRIICSPSNLSVGAVLKVCEEVSGERALVRLASRADSRALSRSVFFDPLVAGANLAHYTPTQEGVARVHAGLIRSLQHGDFSKQPSVA